MQTENLILRLIHINEAEKLLDFELRNRNRFEKVSGTRSQDFYTLETRRNMIERSISAYANQSMIRFGIYLLDDETLIGSIALNDVIWSPALLCTYLGYMIDQDYQNKGYATEAIQVMCTYAFDTLHLHRIEAGVMPSNIASQKVLEKNGFIQEGLARKNVHINGAWQDHLIYALINPKDRP